MGGELDTKPSKELVLFSFNNVFGFSLPVSLSLCVYVCVCECVCVYGSTMGLFADATLLLWDKRTDGHNKHVCDR